MKEPIAEGNNVEFFADGVTAVMPLGESTHVIFHHRQPQTDEGGKVYRMTQARMIVPTAALAQMARCLLAGEVVPQTNWDGDELPLN